MENQYGSDYISISDDEGKEYELEVLSTLEYNGQTYMAVTLADDQEDADLSISILKSIDDENGDPELSTIDDPQELETVYGLIMDQLYEDEEF